MENKNLEIAIHKAFRNHLTGKEQLNITHLPKNLQEDIKMSEYYIQELQQKDILPFFKDTYQRIIRKSEQDFVMYELVNNPSRYEN